VSPEFNTALAGLVIVAAIGFAAVVDRFNVTERRTRRRMGSGETTVEVPFAAFMPPWSPHREPDWPEPVHGALAPQAWRACRPCGGETAVVLHPGAHVCDLGHVTVTAAGVGS